MHLKRITMKGFKSFADKVDMTFEPGVAVVVGPNGSGKSNIVDAITWLMSSAPPSGLRAETGQDVLYLGSAARPAAQYCEVEAVFDNADGKVDIPYGEVSVKRRLERGGDSTYSINGSTVRRLDLLELLADTGIGKDMHSIIGQGKIDRLLAAKPQDRRSAIEEGILVGISSGATLSAIKQKLAETGGTPRILGFNHDTGERYLSIEGFLPA